MYKHTVVHTVVHPTVINSKEGNPVAIKTQVVGIIKMGAGTPDADFVRQLSAQLPSNQNKQSLDFKRQVNAGPSQPEGEDEKRVK